MKWNRWIRQMHRWVSIIFVMIVIAIFGMLGAGRQPAQWVYFVPLLPLALLMLTGLYLFVLPYLGGRGAARSEQQAGPPLSRG